MILRRGLGGWGTGREAEPAAVTPASPLPPERSPLQKGRNPHPPVVPLAWRDCHPLKGESGEHISPIWMYLTQVIHWNTKNQGSAKPRNGLWTAKTPLRPQLLWEVGWGRGRPGGCRAARSAINVNSSEAGLEGPDCCEGRGVEFP